MTGLQGAHIDNTFTDLLYLPNSGAGLGAAPLAVQDGVGSTSPLMLGETTAGVRGWLFAELDPNATDVASSLSFFDTLANSLGMYKLAIVRPGDYTLRTWQPQYIRHLYQGQGVNFNSPSSLAANTFMIDVRSNAQPFIYDLLGKLDGKRTNQSSTVQITGFHAYQRNNVTVRGNGLQGRVTGFTHHGVWLRDANDLTCEELRADDCQADPIHFETTTQNTWRYTARRNFVDRSAETGDCGDTGALKAQNTAAGAYVSVFMYDVFFDDNIIKMGANATNVAVEIWGGAKNARIRGGSIEGPSVGFAASFDHCIGALFDGTEVRSYGALGLEFAGSSNVRAVNGRFTDGASGSTAIIVDNQSVAGSSFLLADNDINVGTLGLKGIAIKGAASIWPTGVVARDNIITGTASGFQAFITDGAAAQVYGGKLRAPNNGYPLTIYAAGKNRGEAVIVQGVYAKGIRPYYVDVTSSFTITGNVFEGTSSAQAVGFLHSVANGVFANNCFDGFWLQHQITANSGYTTDHVMISNLFGNANSQAFGLNPIKNTGGSWGTGDIQFRDATGLYGPYNVTKASLRKWTSDNLLWGDGEYVGNPNGTVEGDAGSILRDPTNGRLYLKTAGTKTASHWFTVVAS